MKFEIKECKPVKGIAKATGKPYTRYDIIDANGLKLNCFSSEYTKICQANNVPEIKPNMVIEADVEEKTYQGNIQYGIKAGKKVDTLYQPNKQAQVDKDVKAEMEIIKQEIVKINKKLFDIVLELSKCSKNEEALEEEKRLNEQNIPF